MIVVSPYKGVSLQNDWVSKVIRQLNKDLSMSGFDKEFDEQVSFSNFVTESILFFESLLEQNDQQLYNLLYRIDVDQKKIYSGHGKPQILITQLVVEREFQKVVLKSQFNNS